MGLDMNMIQKDPRLSFPSQSNSVAVMVSTRVIVVCLALFVAVTEANRLRRQSEDSPSLHCLEKIMKAMEDADMPDFMIEGVERVHEYLEEDAETRQILDDIMRALKPHVEKRVSMGDVTTMIDRKIERLENSPRFMQGGMMYNMKHGALMKVKTMLNSLQEMA